MRRLAALCGSEAGPFQTLPAGWLRLLPADAPLASVSAWTRLLRRLTAADWPDEQAHSPTLRGIVELLSQGHAAAEAIGAALLDGPPIPIRRQPMLPGPRGAPPPPR